MSVATSTPTPQPMNAGLQGSKSGYRQQIQRQLSPITAVIALVATVYFAILAAQQTSWQLFVITGFFSIAWLFSIFARTGLMFSNDSMRFLVMSLMFESAILAMSVFITGMAIPGAALILLYTLIVSSSAMEGGKSEYGISLGLLLAATAAVVGTVAPFRQITNPQLFTVIPTILSILAMLYLTMVMMQFVVATLRIKLVTSILILVLIPLIVLAFINSQFTQNALQAQINQSLRLASQETADQLDGFISRTMNNLGQQAELSAFGNFLRVDPGERDRSLVKEQLQLTVDTLQFDYSAHLTSIAILDLFGNNVFDTNPFLVGSNERGTDYFASAAVTTKPYVSSIKFDEDTGGGYLYFSAPIRTADRTLIGVLRIRYDALVLQTILLENSGTIGSRSHPILLDENQLRIADTLSPSNLYQTVSPLPNEDIIDLRKAKRLPYKENQALSTEQVDLSDAIKRYQFTPYFSLEVHPNSTGSHTEAGAISLLKNQPWTLLFVQEEAGLLNIITQQNQVSTLIAVVIASLVGLLATVIARSFSNPIQKLTSTAAQVTEGNLNARAVVETNDEIGTLANAFNMMTAQVNNLINSLEDRVRERTQELATRNDDLVYRSRQLQTVADVARGIAHAQDLETLLTQITSLISERFNFYHVGVFLVDEKNEYAVLRAANSEGGQKMLARQHKLRVGKVGIVGNVTSTGEARIATDVGEDAVFFNNPDLPMTRSEMALPLKVSNQVIGALDVQSMQSNAFSTEDVALFSTLADQVAIAIENNRLFTETSNALEEAQNIHRQYLQQEWGREIATHQHQGFLYTPHGTIEQEPDELVADVLENIDAPFVARKDQENLTMAATPIQVRGETVGMIRVQDNGADREWTEDELNTIKSVADQVAVALENARLFEQTVRRAEREKKALEITNKIRSTNDPKEMLRIAAEELQAALRASRTQIILEPQSSQPEPANGNGSGDHTIHGDAG